MDLMIDIEALGTVPGSVIAAIGVVAFNPRTGEFGTEASWCLDMEAQRQKGFTFDLKTVKWWMEQSEAARRSTFFSGVEVAMGLALKELTAFVEANMGAAEGVWANSPSFDLAHLEHAYYRDLRNAPWSYRQPRDCRTLFAATGFDYACFKRNASFVAHDALADAKMQARAVVEAYKAVR